MANGAAIAIADSSALDSIVDDNINDAGIGIRIGAATAEAAAVLFLAIAEFRDGGLTVDTKSKSGDTVAKMFELRQAIGEREFVSLVRRYGQVAVRRHLSEVFRHDLDEKESAEAASWATGALLEIVNHVAALEAACAGGGKGARN
jgi:hypothetical protein